VWPIDPVNSEDPDARLLAEIKVPLPVSADGPRSRRHRRALCAADVALEICVLPHFTRAREGRAAEGVRQPPARRRRGLLPSDNLSFGDGIYLRSWLRRRNRSKGGDVKVTCLDAFTRSTMTRF
jgi:hypothetical protein